MSAPSAASPAPPSRRSAARQWLQLFRVPNLFTVPGDPLIGFALAAGALDGRVWAPMAASLCFYAAGLAMNDLCDLAEDQRERPSRPLPSAAISPRAAHAAVLALNLLGLLVLFAFSSHAAFFCGAAVVLAVTFYNRWTKRIAVLGALNMGLCRTLSVLTGAFAVTTALEPRLWWLAGVFGLYIAAVTALARFETSPSVSPFLRLLPVLPALACLHVYTLWGKTPGLVGLVPVLGALAVLGWLCFTTNRLALAEKPFLPPYIGAFIRLLLPLQGLALMFGLHERGLVPGLLLFALWPVARTLSRWFYAS